jgi:hypothetical protein
LSHILPPYISPGGHGSHVESAKNPRFSPIVDSKSALGQRGDHVRHGDCSTSSDVYLVIQENCHSDSSTRPDNAAMSGRGSGIAGLGNAYTQIALTSTIASGNAYDSDVEFVDGWTNPFTTGGYNLIGNGNALDAFDVADQTLVTDPGLAPLADNGGPT